MSEPRRWVTEGPLRLNVEVVEACAYDALAARVEKAEKERDRLGVKAEAAERLWAKDEARLAARVAKAESLLREINEELGWAEQRADPYDAKVILGLRAEIGTALREMKTGQ